jgi:hypothetical protein
VAGGGSTWGCATEQRGRIQALLPTTGGYETQADALEARVASFAEDLAVEPDRLSRAVRSEDGIDRFEWAENVLYLDDKLMAQVGFSKLNDGTWGVGGAQICFLGDGDEEPKPSSVPANPGT